MKKKIYVLIGGFFSGIANVIPGVSAGTILVVMNLFQPIMDNIALLTDKKATGKKKALYFFAWLFLGIFLGVVLFAKVANFLFLYIPNITKFWFVGLIFWSIPIFVKKQLPNWNINWLFLAIGIGIIIFIECLKPDTIQYVPQIPPLSIISCLLLVVIGFIGGLAMLLPGISGSLVLLILGQYYLFKSYLAAITTLQLNVLIPLGFMGVGILLGIVFAAKVCKIALLKYPINSNSLLLGMVVGSLLILIPREIKVYNPLMIMASISAILLGIVMMMYIGEVKHEESD